MQPVYLGCIFFDAELGRIGMDELQFAPTKQVVRLFDYFKKNF